LLFFQLKRGKSRRLLVSPFEGRIGELFRKRLSELFESWGGHRVVGFETPGVEARDVLSFVRHFKITRRRELRLHGHALLRTNVGLPAKLGWCERHLVRLNVVHTSTGEPLRVHRVVRNNHNILPRVGGLRKGGGDNLQSTGGESGVACLLGQRDLEIERNTCGCLL